MFSMYCDSKTNGEASDILNCTVSSLGSVEDTFNVSSPADEMVYIRNQLDLFNKDKQKYKSCVRMRDELELLINSLRVDQSQDGRTLTQLIEELDMIEAEMTSLSNKLKSQKPAVKKLVQRAKKIVP